MQKTSTPPVSREQLDKALSYEQYRALIDRLLEEGKTTGPQQSEDLTAYAKMNVQRMKRLDKTVEINPDLQALLHKSKPGTIWLVLSEGWCGDAAQSLPVLYKMSQVNPNIQFKILLRDENLELMDAYLTHGGRAIPKLIILNEQLEEIGQWGPRPQALQSIVTAYKKNPVQDFKSFSEQLHKWYADNKTADIQQEIAQLPGLLA